MLLRRWTLYLKQPLDFAPPQEIKRHRCQKLPFSRNGCDFLKNLRERLVESYWGEESYCVQEENLQDWTATSDGRSVLMSFGQLYPRSASIHGLLLLPSSLPPSPLVPTVFLMCTFCTYSFCSGRITIHFPFCSLGLSFCSKTHHEPPSQACSSSRMGFSCLNTALNRCIEVLMFVLTG